LRSGLTAVGIAIGIAAMVAVLAISDSSRATTSAPVSRAEVSSVAAMIISTSRR
jgi:ABC-type antimicrobial peptide transport system permease subunit